MIPRFVLCRAAERQGTTRALKIHKTCRTRTNRAGQGSAGTGGGAGGRAEEGSRGGADEAAGTQTITQFHARTARNKRASSSAPAPRGASANPPLRPVPPAGLPLRPQARAGPVRIYEKPPASSRKNRPKSRRKRPADAAPPAGFPPALHAGTSHPSPASGGRKEPPWEASPQTSARRAPTPWSSSGPRRPGTWPPTARRWTSPAACCRTAPPPPSRARPAATPLPSAARPSPAPTTPSP